MISPLNKIQNSHLQRTAYIYVRQSSEIQVQQHQESTRRQYELQQRAGQLGWRLSQIKVIDVDLGNSASDPQIVRPGFEQLVTEVALGQVGAIFSLEVSRLARQDSQWHRLIELASVAGVLLIDEQQVYDPRLADDRLMLGLKGLLSSNELRQMHLRLWENKLHKAQRGQLCLNLPIGLVFDPAEGVRLDPDEQIQGAVRLVFERFGLSGAISQVVRYFDEHHLQFPKHRGGWAGPIEWGRLSCQRVWAMLNNPLYAGCYAYGRSSGRVEAKGLSQLDKQRVWLPPEQWPVRLLNVFEGYLSQAEYEANQQYLARNRQLHQQRGQRQDGAALLTGLALCGLCGQPLHVVYSGSDHQRITYICNHRQRRYAEPTCQRLPGQPVDELVAQVVLAALTPAQVELSLALVAEVQRQQALLRQQWEHRLEGAQYAARLAQRRYEQVDPDNRLVARTLEQQWETKLSQVAQLEQEWASHYQATVQLDPGQSQRLLALAQDLPTVWQAQTTSWTERKQLLRLLVADVTLTRQATDILVQIRWHTDQLDTYTVPLPVRGAPQLSSVLVERIRQLSHTYTDQEVATMLNQEHHQTAQGKSFTARRVQGLRRRYGIAKQLF
jgi:DNA invertase Pin-like site-specific DNA recombinase